MNEIEEPIVEPVVEEPTAEPVVEAAKPTHAEMIAELKAAGLYQEPVRQEPMHDVIEGTNIARPEDYDDWRLDRQIAYISTMTAQGMSQLEQNASRNARAIEDQAEDWFKPYVSKVVDTTDRRYLADCNTDEMRAGILELAMGKAIRDGKTPTKPGAPVPGASPTTTRPNVVTTSSEVDQLLQGVRDAGYAKVAESPVIRELLTREAS